MTVLDEWVERKVDQICDFVPAYTRPRAILLANSGFVWRLFLYLGSMGRAIAGALVHIRSEDDMDLFMRETAERSDDSIARLTRYLREKARVFAVLDDAGLSLRFGCSLFLTALATLGVLAVGGKEMATCAASFCLLWLSVAVESGYEPVCGALRQRYLTALFLRTAALGVFLPRYFARYMEHGIATNVVLQSAMIAMLGVHLLLFVTLILFNTRQMLFLRVLSLLLGTVPALMAAAAVALAAASLAREPVLAAAGVLRAVGALMAFLGDRLMEVTNIGGIRLRYNAIWVWLLLCGGGFFMLVGAWLTAAG